MSSTKAPISQALLDVWEAKRLVQEDTRGMTPEETRGYFRRRSEDLAKALGKRWVKNEDGTCSLR